MLDPLGSSTLGDVRLSILIVDDDAGFRRVARDLLASRGYAIAGEAATLHEARMAVGTQGPDGVLLDVNLPDGDGLDLAAELGGSWPAMRVLLTSTSEGAAPPDLVRRVGAVGFVRKRDLISADLAGYLGGSGDASGGLARALDRNNRLKGRALARLARDRQASVECGDTVAEPD